MIAIELRFITGKFHGTPWGRQVNEGAIEWPPSPWRVLRSLIAVWHLKFPDVPEAAMRELIDVLSAVPSYRLPQSSAGHTRHYMPTVNDAKTKIFDTFIAVPPCEPLVIGWRDAVLSESQKRLLCQLVTAMNYFGRAESWVEAQVVSEVDHPLDTCPLGSAGVGDGEELVRLLTVVPDSDYAFWRDTKIRSLAESKLEEKRAQAISKNKPAKKVTLTAKDKSVIEALVAPDVFYALQANTDELRKAGWNRPPASQWVDFVRPQGRPMPLPSRQHGKYNIRPTIARFAIASPVLPTLTDALWIGERARSYIMGCSKKQNGNQCSEVFSGKAVDGSSISIGTRTHSHAHYLPESLGSTSRGRITHLNIFVPAGLSEIDEVALSRFTYMHGRDAHALQVVLLGIGAPDDFGGIDQRKGQSPSLATSHVWISRTPFVPTNHLHIRGSERHDPDIYSQAQERELDHLVRKELSRRPWLAEHAESVQIERTFHTFLGGARTTWLKFRRERKMGGGTRASTTGYGFKLIFQRPIQGPIALGYGAHFGLGQFVATVS